jgi:hypothetical protein
MQKVKMKSLISLLMITALLVVPVTPAQAVSNSTESNPARFNDGSYVYADIYLGQGMSFDVKGSTWFVPAGSRKNTSIYNKTTVTIAGIGVSIHGLALNQGDSTTYDELENTRGQTWSGISGTVSTDQAWYLNMTGTSYGKVKYDGTSRTSSATVTKWI